jgi:hypothetical protein
MNLKNARVLFEVNTESELAKAVGEINMKLSDGEEIYRNDIILVSEDKEHKNRIKDEPPNIYDKIAGRLNEVSGKDKRIVAAASNLGRELGEFTEDDFYEVLIRVGFTKNEKLKNHLKRLIENDVIFQPKNGIFRYIEE